MNEGGGRWGNFFPLSFLTFCTVHLPVQEETSDQAKTSAGEKTHSVLEEEVMTATVAIVEQGDAQQQHQV